MAKSTSVSLLRPAHTFANNSVVHTLASLDVMAGPPLLFPNVSSMAELHPKFQWSHVAFMLISSSGLCPLAPCCQVLVTFPLYSTVTVFISFLL